MVSNAGIERPAAVQDMSLETRCKVLDVNLTGAFLCARGAARELLRQGLQPEVSSSVGRIIFTSSVHELIPWAFQSNYPASKGGLSLLMKSPAQEPAPAKIRVNSVAPGAVRTSINTAAGAAEGHGIPRDNMTDKTRGNTMPEDTAQGATAHQSNDDNADDGDLSDMLGELRVLLPGAQMLTAWRQVPSDWAYRLLSLGMITSQFLNCFGVGLPMALATVILAAVPGASAATDEGSGDANSMHIARSGAYEMRANAISSRAIPAAAAQRHGIDAAADRGILNVVVREDISGKLENVRATINATKVNLLGQAEPIEMRPVEENGRVSYLGTFGFAPLRNLRFVITGRPDGSAETLRIEFEDKFVPPR